MEAESRAECRYLGLPRHPRPPPQNQAHARWKRSRSVGVRFRLGISNALQLDRYARHTSNMHLLVSSFWIH